MAVISTPNRALCITAHSDRPETELLIKLANAGLKLTVVCHPQAACNTRYRQAGLPVVNLAITGRRDRAASHQLRQLIQTQQPHIIHCFNAYALSNALRAAKGLPGKFIAYRGITGNTSYYNPASLQSFLHPRVARVVCVADAVRQFLLARSFLGWRYPARRFVTIHKGHDPSWYAGPRKLPDSLQIPDETTTLICVANDRPRKGLAILIKAVASIPATLRVCVLLVGRGTDTPRLHRLIQQSGRAERFKLLGYRSDAAALSGASDIVVCPSLRREGLPKTVIEGMIQGVPAIVTDNGGSPELVVNGESGLIVASGEVCALTQAIVKLIHDPPARTCMGRQAKQRIEEHFHIAQTVEKTLQLYQQLCHDQNVSETTARDRDRE